MTADRKRLYTRSDGPRRSNRRGRRLVQHGETDARPPEMRRSVTRNAARLQQWGSSPSRRMPPASAPSNEAPPRTGRGSRSPARADTKTRSRRLGAELSATARPSTGGGASRAASVAVELEPGDFAIVARGFTGPIGRQGVDNLQTAPAVVVLDADTRRGMACVSDLDAQRWIAPTRAHADASAGVHDGVGDKFAHQERRGRNQLLQLVAHQE